MRWKNEMLTAAGLLLVTSAVYAVPAEQLKENYQSIIERNPFGLKPPPAPAPMATNLPEVKPKVEIFLTGITSVGHPKLPRQAYFYTREQGKKDVSYYSLAEQREQDGIEVLQIDPEKREVKIKMDNAETVLSFKTHGVPNTAVASKPMVPGMPGQHLPQVPGQRGAQPLPMPGAAPVSYDGNGQPIYNNAQPINQPNTIAPGNTMNPGSTGLRQIPSRRIRGGSSYNSGGASVPTGPGGIGEGGQPMEMSDPAQEYLKAQLNEAAAPPIQTSSGRVIPRPPVPKMR
jgi:hypothetical protein